MPRWFFVLVVLLAGCRGGERGPYVGTWRMAGADSLDRRYTLLADGTARISERGAAEPRVYEARYDVEGDSVLALRWLDGPPGASAPDARFGVRLSGDTLRLSNPANGVTTAWVRL